MPEKDDKFCLAKDKVDKKVIFIYIKANNPPHASSQNAYGENKSSK